MFHAEISPINSIEAWSVIFVVGKGTGDEVCHWLFTVREEHFSEHNPLTCKLCRQLSKVQADCTEFMLLKDSGAVSPIIYPMKFCWSVGGQHWPPQQTAVEAQHMCNLCNPLIIWLVTSDPSRMENKGEAMSPCVPGAEDQLGFCMKCATFKGAKRLKVREAAYQTPHPPASVVC